MKSKKKTLADFSGIMYSTDPQFIYDHEVTDSEKPLANNQQHLKVMLDKKNRGGKVVTLVTGFKGSLPELEGLAKSLKTHCGVGGGVKETEILLQGDFREKVFGYLQNQGYKVKKAGG